MTATTVFKKHKNSLNINNHLVVGGRRWQGEWQHSRRMATIDNDEDKQGKANDENSKEQQSTGGVGDGNGNSDKNSDTN